MHSYNTCLGTPGILVNTQLSRATEEAGELSKLSVSSRGHISKYVKQIYCVCSLIAVLGFVGRMDVKASSFFLIHIYFALASTTASPGSLVLRQPRSSKKWEGKMQRKIAFARAWLPSFQILLPLVLPKRKYT